jgi:hypothetical protein
MEPFNPFLMKASAGLGFVLSLIHLSDMSEDSWKRSIATRRYKKETTSMDRFVFICAGTGLGAVAGAVPQVTLATTVAAGIYNHASVKEYVSRFIPEGPLTPFDTGRIFHDDDDDD